MAKQRESKTTRLVRRVAAEYGVDIEIRTGGRHRKVYLNDKCVSILPMGTGAGGGRNMLNAIMHIRRAIEESKNGGSDPEAAD